MPHRFPKPRTQALVGLGILNRVVWITAILAVFVVGVSPGMGDETDPQLTDVQQRLATKIAEVRDDFADVQHLTADEIQSLDASPFLIDVRRESEYAVSRIPGAYHAADEIQLLALAQRAGDRPIVVYCSLGVRSSIAVRKLQEQGFENAANLDGSLFAWANDGRPLENDDGATDKAHPFNAWWGRYLLKALHAYEP
ncbi:MAG: rhodanese-like domain-containing protein [Pseudomonadota bacterium]